MVDIALNKNILFDQPDIIAKTGWRTEQLIDTLNRINFTKKFDYVMLLQATSPLRNAKHIDKAIEF
ncbi:MAG: CMP-N-acetlyneuraminic acid synthetase, partial [Gammaproteobacteria bacterium]|nr:CMP-N-acetlyneuraminic acid synthetase [Gammaproteobacteria bacterium]